MTGDDWISVKLRLPPIGELVIVLYDRRMGSYLDQVDGIGGSERARFKVMPATLNIVPETGPEWLDMKGRYMWLVSHWQPLPDPLADNYDD